MADQKVVNQAYVTAISMGVSPNSNVMTALFEAGLVESNFTNLLKATDHDSLGYLQQRPSQGWPNPTDVYTATASFVNRAKPLEGNFNDPGALAQAVQRSAFPGRYSVRFAEASMMIARERDDSVVRQALADIKGGKNAATVVRAMGPNLGPHTVSGVDVGALPGANQFIAVTKFFEALGKADTWRAIGYFVLGSVLIIYSLFKLTGDNQLSNGTKTLVNAASMVVLKKPLLKKAVGGVALTKGNALRGTGGGKTFKGGAEQIKSGATVARTGKL